MIQCHDFRLKIKDELLFTCDLNFKKGFVYVIKGENGSGKTSFLRALKGLFKYEGQVEIKGTMIYQPQHFHLFQKHAKDNFFPELISITLLKLPLITILPEIKASRYLT